MFKQLILELSPFVVSAIKMLIESKIIPAVKRKAYERFDDFADDRIEDLVALKEKAEKTEDSTKKAAHLEGLKLGSATIRAIGEKLIKASALLDK